MRTRPFQSARISSALLEDRSARRLCTALRLTASPLKTDPPQPRHPNAHSSAAMSVRWTNVGKLLEGRAASDPSIVAADRSSGSLRTA